MTFKEQELSNTCLFSESSEAYKEKNKICDIHKFVPICNNYIIYVSAT